MRSLSKRLVLASDSIMSNVHMFVYNLSITLNKPLLYYPKFAPELELITRYTYEVTVTVTEITVQSTYLERLGVSDSTSLHVQTIQSKHMFCHLSRYFNVTSSTYDALRAIVRLSEGNSIIGAMFACLMRSPGFSTPRWGHLCTPYSLLVPLLWEFEGIDVLDFM